jgi:hypothetical protein
MPRIPSLALLLAAAAAGLLAADFWTTRHFTEWNEKEVQQIATNSPWAQRVTVTVMGGGGGAGAVPGGGRRGGGGGGGRSRGGMDDGGPSLVGSLRVPLVIRWQSALPIRQAFARARWGNEVATSHEAAELLARQDDFYVIAISGLPGRMLGPEPDKLHEASGLKIGKTPAYPAAEVRVSRGQRASDVLLFFPRSGHAITVEDKEVEVSLRLAGSEVKRKFQLAKMVFEGKLEL